MKRRTLFQLIASSCAAFYYVVQDDQLVDNEDCAGMEKEPQPIKSDEA